MKKISKLEELIVEERFRESTEEISLDMHHSAAITYFLDPSSMLQFERRDALTISALAQSMQSESKEYASMSYDDQQSILENVSDFNLAYAEVLKRESVEEDIPTESVKMLLQNAKSAAEKGLSEFRSDKFAEDILEAQISLANIYQESSDLDNATSEFQEAITFAKQKFFESPTEVWENYFVTASTQFSTLLKTEGNIEAAIQQLNHSGFVIGTKGQKVEDTDMIKRGYQLLTDAERISDNTKPNYQFAEITQRKVRFASTLTLLTRNQKWSKEWYNNAKKVASIYQKLDDFKSATFNHHSAAKAALWNYQLTNQQNWIKKARRKCVNALKSLNYTANTRDTENMQQEIRYTLAITAGKMYSIRKPQQGRVSRRREYL